MAEQHLDCYRSAWKVRILYRLSEDLCEGGLEVEFTLLDQLHDTYR